MDLSYVFLQRWQTHLLLPSALLLSLNLVECSTLTLTIFALSQVWAEILKSFLTSTINVSLGEQTIYHLKSCIGSDVICTYDHISIFSDLLLSAITYSLLFILAHNIKLYCSKLTIKKLNKLKNLSLKTPAFESLPTKNL